MREVGLFGVLVSILFFLECSPSLFFSVGICVEKVFLSFLNGCVSYLFGKFRFHFVAL